MTATPRQEAEFQLKHGNEFPYDQGIVQSADWAVKAARAIASDLCDRRGIKWEMGEIEYDIRTEMIESWAEILRVAAEEPNPETTIQPS